MKALLYITALAYTCTTFAQPANSLTLREISERMYRDGNEKYIIVDAVADSLITLPAAVEFLKMGDHFFQLRTNKGAVQLTPDIEKQYREKLSRFLIQEGETADATVHIVANRQLPGLIVTDNILYPDSWFRTPNAEDRYAAGITTAGWKKIFIEMDKDGLLPASYTYDFSMYYSKEGISISGRTLEGMQGRKYLRMFREELGLDLERGNISGSMTYRDMKKYLEDDIATTAHAVFDGKGIITQAELETISKELFEKGDIHFLVIDMIHDGLLRDGKSVNLSYTSGVVSLEGVRLSLVHKSRYEQKMEAFRKKHKLSIYESFSITGTVNFRNIANGNH